MKITCDIIQDLLPLYADRVLSEDSRLLVEEHLTECPVCSERLSKDLPLSSPIEATASAEPLKRIKKKMLKKNLVIALIVAVCILLLCASAVFFVFFDEIPIAYDPTLVSAKEADDETIDIYKTGDYYGSSAEIRDGNVYISFTTSRWINHRSDYKYDDAKFHAFSISKTVLLDNSNGKAQSAKQIKAIYYQSDDDAKPHLLWKAK